jgi:NitT/TauT family transport system substrate-binding protein
MTQISRRCALQGLGATAALPMLASPALANTKITVGALRFTSHAASFVAVERGLFADAGLDVELKFFDAAQPMALAIASGDVDYAVTAISGGLISLAEKGAIKVFGGGLVEEEGIDGQKILASDAAFQAGLTAPAMLDGKSFGITQAGSSFHYMGSKIAAAEGASVTMKPLNAVGAIIGALKSGQIDAWSIVPHIAKPLAASGAVHIIGNVSDYLPGYMVTTLFTSAENAANDRARTEAFLQGYVKGADQFNAAMIDKTLGDDGINAMVDVIHKYVYADQPREKAAKSIINGSMRLKPGAALDMASLTDQLDWFKSEGLVKDSVTMEMLVDTSYVETA